MLGTYSACLIVLASLTTSLIAQDSSGGASSPGPSMLRVTHVLGFEGVSNNVNGNLSVEKDGLRFQRGDGVAAKISIGSIQSVLLGVQDRQVGGLPLTLGRAATPFEGGRFIALFSHKKYDTVTLEYLDANGGFHGAIFQLKKGEGDLLKTALVAGGAHLTEPPTELKNERK